MTSTDTVPYSAPVERNPTPNRNVSQFSLNHPKNYFGVPLAVAAPGDTGLLITDKLVRMGGRARAGAEALGLIDPDGNLTDLGETVVALIEEESTVEAELDRFESMKGSSERFIETAPRYWQPIAKHILQEYAVAGDVVTVLETTGPVTLAELTAVAIRNEHPLQESLLRDPETFDSNSFDEDDAAELKFPDVYAGQAIYQFKNLLYHCGILTERGADTSAVVPTQDVWALEPSLLSLGGDA